MNILCFIRVLFLWSFEILEIVVCLILNWQSTDGTVFFFVVGEKYSPIGFICVPGPVQALEWSPHFHVRNFLLLVHFFQIYYGTENLLTWLRLFQWIPTEWKQASHPVSKWSRRWGAVSWLGYPRVNQNLPAVRAAIQAFHVQEHQISN